MYTFLIIIHIIACLLLIVIILLQAGRAGGLGLGFGAAESIFGTKTNVFLTKLTVAFAVMFLITCLGLTVFSVQRRRSLIERELLKGKIQEPGGVFPQGPKQEPSPQGAGLPAP
jgi:preprotein translocase subunit SecG